MSAFLANVFPTDNSLGASAWGTSPWHWYFTSALPRLLLNPIAIPLLAYSAISQILGPSSTPLLLPPLIYTALYSLLPHKEARFLFPILPPLTTATALAAHRLTTKHFPLRPVVLLITLATALLSHLLLAPLSSLSYPGAHALLSLHTLAHNTTPHLRIHLDNLSLQTGITRFLQLPPPSSPLLILPGRLAPGGAYSPEYHSGASMWVYDKSENATEQLDPEFWRGFDYCIMEEPGLAIGAWDVQDVVYGLGRPRIVRPGKKHVTGDRRGTWSLVEAMYGEWVAGVYEFIRTALEEGAWTSGDSAAVERV
jgi:alpha-1,6-mannosyltransferase